MGQILDKCWDTHIGNQHQKSIRWDQFRTRRIISDDHNFGFGKHSPNSRLKRRQSSPLLCSPALAFVLLPGGGTCMKSGMCLYLTVCRCDSSSSSDVTYHLTIVADGHTAKPRKIEVNQKSHTISVTWHF